MNFEEYELKSKDEGYFYVECNHVFSTTKAYGFDKQVYEHKILSEISLEDIKKTIHLFEDWYVAYKNSEIANDDDDLDSDNFDRNRVIHFKTIVLPCHDMDSDKLCNLFEQVYDKFYKTTSEKHKRIGLLKTKFGGDFYPRHYFRIYKEDNNFFNN